MHQVGIFLEYKYGQISFYDVTKRLIIYNFSKELSDLYFLFVSQMKVQIKTLLASASLMFSLCNVAVVLNLPWCEILNHKILESLGHDFVKEFIYIK